MLRFIQTDLPSLRSDLSGKLTDANEDITNLSKKQKFLEGRFMEAQGSFKRCHEQEGVAQCQSLATLRAHSCTYIRYS